MELFSHRKSSPESERNKNLKLTTSNNNGNTILNILFITHLHNHITYFFHEMKITGYFNDTGTLYVYDPESTRRNKSFLCLFVKIGVLWYIAG